MSSSARDTQILNALTYASVATHDQNGTYGPRRFARDLGFTTAAVKASLKRLVAAERVTFFQPSPDSAFYYHPTGK